MCFFFDLTVFLFIFTATLVKKLLKVSEISLALLIIWLSMRRLEIDSSDCFFMFIVPLMVSHTSLRFFCCLQNIAYSKNLLSFWAVKYMITIWFELFFLMFFCFWIFFFAEAFVQFMFVTYGQTRSDPWFSFIVSFWIFDSLIWNMFI